MDITKLKYLIRKIASKILIVIIALANLSVVAQSVLFEGNPFQNSEALPPAMGSGVRMMWFPERAAFRVGQVSDGFSDAWDRDNIGLRSVAWGINTLAKRAQSTAWGFESQALGDASTCWGEGSIARGTLSTSWGFNSIARSSVETALGQFNDTLATNNPINFIGTDYLLVVGNGTSNSNRSNALELYKNGSMRLGGALSLKNEAETMTSDNQLITVGSRGYIRVASDAIVASNRTALLSDGTAPGQILYLECNCAAAAWELPDAGNINLPATRTFNSGNVIQLLWNGTTWLEVHFSDN